MCLLLWTQGEIHIESEMWKDTSIFFRKVDDLPEIYEALLFEIGHGNIWVTSGKTGWNQPIMSYLALC